MNKSIEYVNVYPQKEVKRSFGIFGSIFYLFSLSAILMAIFTLLVFYYWAIAPVNVLDVNNPVPVEKKMVAGGDTQILDFSFCKNLDVKGDVEWSLISNKNIILLPSYEDTLRSTCMTKVRAPVILPFVIHSDIYHFHYSTVYHVNPIRTVMVQFDSQSFEITEK